MVVSKSITLSTAGPHSPENTQRLAWAAAEAIRCLNHHLTDSASDALPGAPDVAGVFAELALMAERLPQLFGLLSARLQDLNAAGQITVPEGGSAEAVMEAGVWLLRANDSAAGLKYAMGQAHQITATMSGTGGDDG